MKTIKFLGQNNKEGHPILIDEKGKNYLFFNGIPHSIDANGEPLLPLVDYRLIYDTFINKNKSKLSFYTKDKNPDTLIVLDESLHLEKSYTIGKYQYLSNDGIDEGIPTLIESFAQVITAWRNNEIFF